MIQLIYTNNTGQSITFPSADYKLNKLSGLDNTDQDVFTQKSPGIDGAKYIGSLYQPREITLEGATSSGTVAAMYTKRAYLNRIINDRNIEGTLQINIYDSVSVKSYTIKGVANIRFAAKDASTATARFNIVFKCSSPFFNILPINSEILGLTVSNLTFPVTFPVIFSYSSGSNSKTVVNSGNVETGVLFTVTGACQNPTITNETTGEYLKFLGLSLATGQVMTIQTGYDNNVTVDMGLGDTNGMRYLDLNSRFFYLQPGNNIITIDDDFGFPFGTCSLSWYNKLTGV